MASASRRSFCARYHKAYGHHGNDIEIHIHSLHSYITRVKNDPSILNRFSLTGRHKAELHEGWLNCHLRFDNAANKFTPLEMSDLLLIQAKNDLIHFSAAKHTTTYHFHP